MKAKLLLLGSLVSALLTSAQAAEVYSINAVGYVTKNVGPGFELISNPLYATNNTVAGVLPSVPVGTKLFKFDPTIGNYLVNRFLANGWLDPNMAFNPGEGAFVQNLTATNLSLLFSGEVAQGSLTNSINAGFSIRSSQVPQQGGLQTLLNFPVANGDKIFVYDPSINNYLVFRFISNTWIPSEPVINVGQSFFIQKLNQVNWVRNFTVN